MGIPETAALAHLTWEQQSHYSPLAFCRLWDSPRTSQVRSVRAVLAPGIRYGFILGGNRAGKSDALAQLMTAIALGADHPDAARWCEVNGIPPDRIGWNPGPVWVSSPDFGDSREYVRPKFDALAPAGSIWRNQHADKEATLRYPNGGRVQFKAVQQGRDSYQGSAIKAAGFDEEPNDYAVVKECKMRLVDLDGRMYFSMTPLLGWTELLTEYVEKRPANCAVEYLSGEDNPHLPAGILAELLEGFGDHERESRAHGTIAVLEGLIYGLRRQVHLCSPFEIPAEWARYLGIDFGTANPFAAVFCAHDEGDDVLYVYDLHYQRQWTNKEHAREILRRHKGAPPFRTVQADPSGKDGIMTLNEHGIPAEGAHRDVKGRIAAVQQRMRLDAEGLPHLRVFETEATRPLVKEFESYRWRTGKDEPVKDNDHCLVAGTVVETENGPAPIENVEAGVRVHTRQGPRRVLASAITNPAATVYRVEFSNGAAITGTGGHPIWTDRGWITIDALGYGDRVTTWSKPSSTTGSRFGGIPTPRTDPTVSISLPAAGIAPRGSVGSTRKCGATNADRYPPDFTSTTPTGIPSTIRLTTLNAYPLTSTRRGISGPPPKASWITSNGSAHSHQNGTEPRRVGHGTLSMAVGAGKIGATGLLSASVAVSPTRAALPDPSCTARRNARPQRAGRLASTTRIESATSVEQPTASIDTATSGPAAVYVVARYRLEHAEPVYNLTVEDVPEFYANGILVHNCLDALGYIAQWLRRNPAAALDLDSHAIAQRNPWTV